MAFHFMHGIETETICLALICGHGIWTTPFASVRFVRLVHGIGMEFHGICGRAMETCGNSSCFRVPLGNGIAMEFHGISGC